MKNNINNQPVNKNDEIIVEIIDYGANGEGIAKINGYTIFVIGALKGEKCKIHILKVLKDYAFAKVIEILEESKKREKPDCSTYTKCGGCSLRHINYEETLKIKTEKVQNLMSKMLKKDIKVNEAIGMDKPYYYRNKAIYPINEDGKIGLYAERSHNVIPIDKCKIQTEKSQEIAKFILENWKDSIYNEKTGEGLLRNIMIREGLETGEIMVVLVQNGEKKYEPEILLEKFPEITTIVVNVNKKYTNVVLGKKNIVIYGKGYIKDCLDGLIFKISPNSFYQVNPIQTKILYNKAIELSNLNKNDILFDLYCGIGTIGIFAAKDVKKVYGIEIVPQAIDDAKENATINKIDNCEFVLGDVENAFEKLINDKKIIPTTIIVDPPRKGLDENTINNILKIKPNKLTYISCNPATLARDLSKLEDTYEIKEIQPVDMFPFTSHVECVCFLKIK